MSKTPRLEFLETRNLLAGEDDDPSGMEFKEDHTDDVEDKSKWNDKAQEDFYGALLFFSILAGTALFVGLGIYFGETV